MPYGSRVWFLETDFAVSRLIMRQPPFVILPAYPAFWGRGSNCGQAIAHYFLPTKGRLWYIMLDDTCAGSEYNAG